MIVFSFRFRFIAILHILRLRWSWPSFIRPWAQAKQSNVPLWFLLISDKIPWLISLASFSRNSKNTLTLQLHDLKILNWEIRYRWYQGTYVTRIPHLSSRRRCQFNADDTYAIKTSQLKKIEHGQSDKAWG